MHKKTSAKKIFSTIGILMFSYVGLAFANPPSGGYTSGATLDPDCVPGSTDCKVNLGSSLTFSTGLTNTSNTITNNLSTGVSGGQSVIGGTASGDSLTLSSTSNATKGKLLFGTSAYDEMNNILGIGTSSPLFKMHIVSNSTDFSGGTYGMVNQFNADTNFSARFLFYKSRGTAASPTAVLHNDAIGSLQFFGYDGTNYFNQAAINVDAIASGSSVPWSSSSRATQMRFNTTDLNSTTSTERMRILYNGNIGIGITAPTGLVTLSGSRSPAAAWDVNGPIFQVRAITVTDTVTGASSTVSNAMMNTIAIPTIVASNTGVTYTNAATLYIAGAPTAGTNVTLTNKAALVVASGNVGIGTTAPGLLLSVGSASATDGNQLRIQDANGTCDHNPGSASEVVTCTSDARLKENIRSADPALNDLMQFSIKQYDAISDHAHYKYGVLAQDVLVIDPSMVHTREDGFYGVEEVSSWKIVKAIQELGLKVDDISTLATASNHDGFTQSIRAWFASATNDIASFFSNKITTKNLCVADDSGAETCLTKQQLDALIMNTHSSTAETTGGVVSEPPASGGQATVDAPDTATAVPVVPNADTPSVDN